MPAACATIVNPAAANGRAGSLWPVLVEQLREHGFEPEVFLTTATRVATQLTRQALHAGHNTIIAIGGDGTVNEVINGFFEDLSAIELADQPINPAAKLGIISCGTGADLVKSLGLPPRAAAIPHLVTGNTIPLDLGLATFKDLDGRPTRRYFLNIADLGLGGEVVARVNRTTKAFGGFATFLWSTAITILGYHGKPIEVLLDNEDMPIKQCSTIVVAANGQYFGGGMHVAPAASLTDGLLDIFLLEEVPKPLLLFNLLPRIYRGTHVGHPKVRMQRARCLLVRSEDRLLLELDGELVGFAEVEFRVLPAALPVLVPDTFASKPLRGTNQGENTNEMVRLG